MYMRGDWIISNDAAARSPEIRECDRQRIAKHTREFLAKGGKITVIKGYTAPVAAKTGYKRHSIFRGNRTSSAKKHFK